MAGEGEAMTNFQESERRRALWGIDWPGHPDGADRPKVGAPERDLAGLEEAPELWTLPLVAHDPGADYDYDDLALLRREDGEWALVRTTGCSCPSPTETWGYVARGTLEDVARHIEEDRVSWGGKSRGPYQEMREHVAKLRAEP